MSQILSGMEFTKTTCKTYYWVQVPKTEIRSHNQGPYKKSIGLTSLLKVKILVHPFLRIYWTVIFLRILDTSISMYLLDSNILAHPFLRIYSTAIFLRILDSSISTYLLDSNILAHSSTIPFLRIYSTVLFLRIPAHLHFYVSTRQ